MYISPGTGFELTTLVVICTDCIGSCKSNYHAMTATATPLYYGYQCLRIVVSTVCSIIYVSTFSVPCCDVHYDFRIKTMFGSSFPTFVCRWVHVLFMLFVFVSVSMLIFTWAIYFFSATVTDSVLFSFLIFFYF